jgi:hypothetical protein
VSIRSSDIETGVSNVSLSGQVCPSASIQYNCINSGDGQTGARTDTTAVLAAQTQSSASVPPFPIASYPPQPSSAGTHSISAIPLRIPIDLSAASRLMDSEAYTEQLACTELLANAVHAVQRQSGVHHRFEGIAHAGSEREYGAAELVALLERVAAHGVRLSVEAEYVCWWADNHPSLDLLGELEAARGEIAKMSRRAGLAHEAFPADWSAYQERRAA